jgi:hypothetical protein
MTGIDDIWRNSGELLLVIGRDGEEMGIAERMRTERGSTVVILGCFIEHGEASWSSRCRRWPRCSKVLG